MPDFTNPVVKDNNEIEEIESFVEHGIDIVDYNTVCYDKNSSRLKRSLSLNIYKYQKVLDSETSNEFPIAKEGLSEKEFEVQKGKQPGLIDAPNEKMYQRKRQYPKTNYCIPGLFLFFFLTCLSALGFIVFNVFENTDRVKRIEENFAEVGMSIKKFSNTSEKNSKSLNTIYGNIANVRNDMERRERNGIRNVFERKQFESQLTQILNSTMDEISNIEDKMLDSLRNHHRSYDKISELMKKIVGVENNIIKVFNNNSYRQHEMATSLTELESKLKNLHSNIANVTNDMERLERDWIRNVFERKQFESQQTQILNSAMDKISNIEDKMLDSLRNHHRSYDKISEFMNKIVGVENNITKAFNNNSYRQNEMARSLADLESKLDNQLIGLNTSIYASVYTVLKNQISNMILLQDVLSQNNKKENELNNSLAMINSTIQTNILKSTEMELSFNKTIESILLEIDNGKENETSVMNQLREEMKILQTEIEKNSQLENSSETFDIISNVTALKNGLESLKNAICKTHGCQNNGTCGVENNKFICKCIPGYFGDKCSSSVCDNLNCNHGRCIVTGSGVASCVCSSGYFGSRCEEDVCDNLNCNHGHCIVTRSGIANCVCSSGYFGSRCEKAVMEASCSNTYGPNYVKTPNYPYNYGHNRDCTWKISAESNRKIKLSSFSIDTEYHQNCGYDYLAIYDGSTSSGRLVAKLCGSKSQGTIFSSGNSLYLHFNSDTSEHSTGFLINYSIVD